MKIKHLLSQLIRSVILFCIVFFIFGGLNAAVLWKMFKYWKEEGSIKLSIQNVENNIKSIQDKRKNVSDLKDDILLLLNRNAGDLQHKLNDSSVKYNMEELAKSLSIEIKDYNFTEIAIDTINDEYDDQSRFSVFTNVILIKFAAIDDGIAYKFIEHMYNIIPGFRKVEILDITKNTDITKKHLFNIINGNFASTVDVLVVFNVKNVLIDDQYQRLVESARDGKYINGNTND